MEVFLSTIVCYTAPYKGNEAISGFPHLHISISWLWSVPTLPFLNKKDGYKVHIDKNNFKEYLAPTSWLLNFLLHCHENEQRAVITVHIWSNATLADTLWPLFEFDRSSPTHMVTIHAIAFFRKVFPIPNLKLSGRLKNPKIQVGYSVLFFCLQLRVLSGDAPSSNSAKKRLLLLKFRISASISQSFSVDAILLN